MARYYPPKHTGADACSECRGTGRVQKPRQPGAALLMGDNTELCAQCWGTGRSRGVEDELAGLIFRRHLRAEMERRGLELERWHWSAVQVGEQDVEGALRAGAAD